MLEAFACLGDAEFHFVGGYRLEEVVARYPNIYFSVSPDWKRSGAAASLLAAPLDAGRAAYVCYADIVFSPEVVAALAAGQADITVCVDRQWRERYAGRSKADLARAEKVILNLDGRVDLGRQLDPAAADGELVGVFRLSRRAIAAVKTLDRQLGDSDFRHSDMPGLISRLASLGLSIDIVENPGRWAELNAPQDLARFVLGTKAETLERLRPLVQASRIGEQICFTASDWRRDPAAVIAAIQQKFGTVHLVVRSSAGSEDGWAASNAGGYESVLDVPAQSAASITEAVDRVIASYGRSDPGDQVLVQAMLGDVVLGGVAFTRTLTHGAPYYVLNYDDSSGRTDGVTSGAGHRLRTLFVQRSHRAAVGRLDRRTVLVLDAIAELEDLVGHTSLDIEFAVDRQGAIHVLQLRPIAVRHGLSTVSDEHVESALSQAAAWFCGAPERGSRLLGTRTLFGVMSDWNPAEIVGTKPRRLAMSLYRHLITDDVWATQRAEYGYRDVRPCPLVVNFAGHPYVDIRASFNSFVPAGLDEGLASLLVEHYLQRLEQHPELHDKVEFDVAFTCLTFDFEERAHERLAPAGFSETDIATLGSALRGITREGMSRVDADEARIAELDRRYQALRVCRLAPLDMAFELLEDCRRFGTLAFAHLARSAFVAVSLLRSLERTGVTTREDSSAFLASLETVTRAFERDGARVYSGQLARDAFVARYGHLRPGTYEITSDAYADDPGRYLEPMIKPEASASRPFAWSPAARVRIEALLHRHGLEPDVDAFERFLRRAITGREYAKFMFSRNLSAALGALVAVGAAHALDRESVSHLDIADLYKLRVGAHPTDVAAWLAARAEEGAAEHDLTRAIELPPLIVGAGDFECFERPASEPNFVSQGRVAAEVAVLADGEAITSAALSGKVVVIPRADPGYDWLFAHGIGGLITQYGGANSHMAIRAAELGLPAAIGVGDALFERLVAARLVVLDCAVRRIEIQA
ncbi:PEP-utilizing enzyme [Accumulibacter sp.]|uniref:PEP-utilizing enzyme n=1 Tax=Accumulibacter sp. TaxID=2053492 RepID=UPI0025E41A0A|nr:PEP-utilizing enzyme [Accumulibacter sp.]MCM8594223.1 PEP-utilizing enzyme [Accumulibacter sp.]MCM8625789.1 PEP-utilizing enzyme [Accumulibacter sp.]MDS4048366.1 PEP-utilizing enzyme [Accumulibacter sp.]